MLCDRSPAGAKLTALRPGRPKQSMTLWFILALMTVAAVFAVLWPLSRRRPAATAAADVAVYRDQLDELERDRAAGLIGAAEAEAARVEIARRLIAAADTA